MKVLIIGATGQLGRALFASAPPGVQVTAPPRTELDLTDAASIDECLSRARPDVVLNAAAYTQVEQAEAEPAAAFAVNAQGVEQLARVAAAIDSRVVHVSTDYVFDGERGIPYQESDATAPLSAYGRSKLDGERRIDAVLGPRCLTIRTSWLYAARGANFVVKMLALMRRQETVSVVCDQVGTPTSVRSLAHVLWSACERPKVYGLLHWTDAGVASWYDFAMAIAEEAARAGLLANAVHVRPIPSSEYPTKARRPSYSVLDTRRARACLALDPAHWRVRLREVMREMSCPPC